MSGTNFDPLIIENFMNFPGRNLGRHPADLNRFVADGADFPCGGGEVGGGGAEVPDRVELGGDLRRVHAPTVRGFPARVKRFAPADGLALMLNFSADFSLSATGSSLRRGSGFPIVSAVEGKIFWIKYRFDFSDGDSKEFLIELEKPSLRLRSPRPTTLPGWTNLSHHQCLNCPLSTDRYSHCPIAVNLVGVIEAFSDVMSHEEADVEVITESRKYSARLNVTHAVGSLVGIFMVTSGCPIMDRLKPMVLTHLPFPTREESSYRSISMYLMAQYFRYKNGMSADWNLEKFGDFFEDINLVNQAFVKRLTTFVDKDVLLNAVVLLNCFATATKRVIALERFEEVEQMFGAFLDGPVNE
jgi:hypothetical protein